MTIFEDQDKPFFDAIYAGGEAAVLLLLEHVGMWPLRIVLSPDDELAPLFPYASGTLALIVALARLERKRPITTADLMTISVVGGTAVAAARLYRKWLRLALEIERENGHISGHVAGIRRFFAHATEPNRIGLNRKPGGTSGRN